MAVRGVGVKRRVGDDTKLRQVFFQGRDSARYQALGIDGFTAIGRFKPRLNGREQCQCGYAQLRAFFGAQQQLVDGVAFDAGHRGDFLRAVFAIDDEHRIDQVVHSKAVLAHQAA